MKEEGREKQEGERESLDLDGEYITQAGSQERYRQVVVVVIGSLL